MPKHTPVKITDRPDLYDWLYNDEVEDIPVYLKLSGNTETVLECGIGTGRIAIPLAKKGKEVFGIDNSEPMLELLAKKMKKQPESIQNRIHFFNQDMRDFNLGRKFSYIYVPFSTFNYLLSIKDQKDALNSINRHLNDDGILVLELLSFSYQPFGLVASKETEVRKTAKSLSNSNETVELTVRSEFNSSTQIIREWRYFSYYNNEGQLLRKEVVEWDNRFFFIGELECVLELTGFEIIKKYGDHSLKQELMHENQFAVIVAKKK